jgi:C1A family cysteine protease
MAEGEALVASVAAEIQSEGLPWTAAPNELTALPQAEREERLGVIVTREELARLAAETAQMAAQEQLAFGAAFAAPTAVNWQSQGYVTPVKNQGGCGSCVSFCSCSVIESAVRIKLQNPSYAIDLSEGFMQFCGGGSCSGWGLTSGLDYAKSTGVTDDACMPYQAQNMNCTASRCSDWQNRLTKITNYSGHATMAARKDAIANIGPVLAGLAVFNDFFAYSSGIYVKTTGSGFAGYHCISVVGYDDNQQCWIIKNSWGTGWGESGFGRIRYNQAELLIDTDWMFYDVAVTVQPVWYSNVTVTQTYATVHSQNAWAHFQGMGWRRIQTGSADGVTNLLALFAEAVANNRPVNIVADGSFVYQGYLL